MYVLILPGITFSELNVSIKQLLQSQNMLFYSISFKRGYPFATSERFNSYSCQIVCTFYKHYFPLKHSAKDWLNLRRQVVSTAAPPVVNNERLSRETSYRCYNVAPLHTEQ